MSQESKVSRVEGMCRDVALRDSRQVTSDMTHMTDVTWLMTWGSPWVKPSSQARQSGRRTLRVQGAESRIQSAVKSLIKSSQYNQVQSRVKNHVTSSPESSLGKSSWVRFARVKSQMLSQVTCCMSHACYITSHKCWVLTRYSLTHHHTIDWFWCWVLGSRLQIRQVK